MFSLLALAGGLAGCARQPHPTQAALPEALPPAEAAAPVVPAALATRPDAPQRPVFAMGQLPPLGDKTAEELRTLLGEPDFMRRDPPAEIWQYRSATCVLDIFLYRDGAALKVVHAATRDRTLGPSQGRPCTPFGGDRAQG